MGLDIVELVFAVEDAFGISITDEEASHTATVGQLHALVMSKLGPAETPVCLTSAAFYRTRRALMETVPIPRREIRPSTPVEEVFPRRRRRELWPRFRRELALKLPELAHPGWTMLSLLACAIAVAVVYPVTTGQPLSAAATWSLLAIPLWALFLKLTASLATRLPDGMNTVGDLSRIVLALNHAHFARTQRAWSPDEVWESLCRVIVEQTGVPRYKIAPEATFAGDLGLD